MPKWSNICWRLGLGPASGVRCLCFRDAVRCLLDKHPTKKDGKTASGRGPASAATACRRLLDSINTATALTQSAFQSLHANAMLMAGTSAAPSSRHGRQPLAGDYHRHSSSLCLCWSSNAQRSVEKQSWQARCASECWCSNSWCQVVASMIEVLLPTWAKEELLGGTGNAGMAPGVPGARSRSAMLICKFALCAMHAPAPRWPGRLNWCLLTTLSSAVGHCLDASTWRCLPMLKSSLQNSTAPSSAINASADSAQRMRAAPGTLRAQASMEGRDGADDDALCATDA